MCGTRYRCAAAGAGMLALVTTALRLGGDPAPRAARLLRGHTAVNEHGLPPLHIAARAGHTPVVRALLDARAPVTLLSSAGLPPLVVCALRLTHCTPSPPEKCCTPLTAASRPPCARQVAAQTDEALDTLDLLLAAGAPMAMRDDRRQTALHAAARAGSVEALRRLLSAARAEEANKREEAAARAAEGKGCKAPSQREPSIELRDRCPATLVETLAPPP